MQRLAEGMGITFKRHGADLLGLCPFHDNRTILDDYAQTEPVALPGCVSVRRLSYRLGSNRPRDFTGYGLPDLINTREFLW